MLFSMFDKRLFAATPPTIINSFFFVNESARSVASLIIANAVSCNEKHAFSFCDEIDFVADKRPENETSFPFTT